RKRDGSLLYDLIGPQQERGRDGEAELPSSLQVDHELVLSWRFDGKRCRARSAQDFVNEECSTAELFAEANRVRHESSRLTGSAGRTHHGQAMLTCQLGDALSLREQERVCRHDERVTPISRDGHERAFQIIPVAYIDQFDVYREHPPGGLVIL